MEITVAQDNKLMFPLSTELKLAMGEFASANDISIAALIRKAVSEYINYDLTLEGPSTRSNKIYANKAERQQAQKDRQKAQRLIVREAKESLKQGDRRAAVMALARSLGIEDLDDLMNEEEEEEESTTEE